MPIRTSAPTMTPGMLPMPPRMITASAVIETTMLKPNGSSDPICTENRAPDRHPMAAPMAKASSLYLTVLIPIASATCSSSRMAFQARPIRDRERR